jgi:acetoin utilization deacetylase AcuC-like enzyme
VSCGFDAHRDDPLASMQVSRAGFSEMTRTLRAVAEDVCAGRVVYVLEGGYAESGLYEGTAAVLDAMLPIDPPAPAAAPEAPPGSTLAQVIHQVRAVHAGRFPDLGVA